MPCAHLIILWRTQPLHTSKICSRLTYGRSVIPGSPLTSASYAFWIVGLLFSPDRLAPRRLPLVSLMQTPSPDPSCTLTSPPMMATSRLKGPGSSSSDPCGRSSVQTRCRPCQALLRMLGVHKRIWKHSSPQMTAGFILEGKAVSDMKTALCTTEILNTED